MKNISIVSILILTLLITMNISMAANTPFQTKRDINAISLMEDIQESIDLILTSYKTENPDKDPFYISVRNVEDKVSLLKNSLKRKEKNINECIGNTTTAICDLRVTYRYESIKNKDVEVGVTALVNGWDTFNGHYVENLPKDSKFTDDDAKQMEELKQKSKDLENKLADLQKQLGESNNLSEELKQMREENKRILNSQNSSADLLASITVFQSLMGWWNGYSRSVYYYYPSYYTYFSDWPVYWRNVDYIITPAYNDYFININTTTYWDNTWVCDRPISIDDRDYFIMDGQDQIIYDNSNPVFHDTLDNSGTFYIDNSNNIQIDNRNNEDFYIKDSDLKDSDLKDSDLKDSDLKDSDLKDSDLKDSDLKDSDLKDSDLKDSDLKDSDLKDSDLKDSDLKDNDLKDNDLNDNDLNDNDLNANDNDFNTNDNGSDMDTGD